MASKGDDHITNKEKYDKFDREWREYIECIKLHEQLNIGTMSSSQEEDNCVRPFNPHKGLLALLAVGKADHSTDIKSKLQFDKT